MADSVSPVSTVVLPTTMRVVAPVGRAPDPATDAPTGGAGGNSRPESGDALPPSDSSPTHSLATAVERLNEILRAAERRVRFRIDEASGKTLIFVVNAATGEVVRQIPPEQVLSLARRFGMPGGLVDARV